MVHNLMNINNILFCLYDNSINLNYYNIWVEDNTYSFNFMKFPFAVNVRFVIVFKFAFKILNFVDIVPEFGTRFKTSSIVVYR